MARQNTPGPAPDVVREFRTLAGLTQEQAGALVHVERRTWEKWEKPEANPEHRRMPMAHFELFSMKVLKQAKPTKKRPNTVRNRILLQRGTT